MTIGKLPPMCIRNVTPKIKNPRGLCKFQTNVDVPVEMCETLKGQIGVINDRQPDESKYIPLTPELLKAADQIFVDQLKSDHPNERVCNVCKELEPADVEHRISLASLQALTAFIKTGI